MIQGLIQGRDNCFSSSPRCKDHCVVIAASCSLGTRAVWGLKWPGCEVYHWLLSSAKVKNEQKYKLYSLCLPSRHLQGRTWIMGFCECGYKHSSYIKTEFSDQLNKWKLLVEVPAHRITGRSLVQVQGNPCSKVLHLPYFLSLVSNFTVSLRNLNWEFHCLWAQVIYL